ncbi:MAG: aminoacyl-tRNA hydrolase [Ignavibacteria bacterium]|nr:aminoacyl-tRNA hydrolase [Ignavibacteria bacterium]
MKLIVGLGNPGVEYIKTRHNAGFLAIDFFCDNMGLNFRPGKGEWYEAEYKHKREKIYLMKPTTFMNASGKAIADFVNRKKIDLSNILIVFDDFQLPLGTIRVRAKGSDGGHKGMASIIYSLNSLEFPRMRIGIGTDKIVTKDNYTDFVLSNFSEEEFQKLKILMPNIRDAILCFIDEGIYSTMNKFNKNYFNNKKVNSDNTTI